MRPSDFNLIKYGAFATWVWFAPDRPRILKQWLDEPLPKAKKGGSKKFDKVKFTREVADYISNLPETDQGEFIQNWFNLYQGSKRHYKHKTKK